jgi:hypothetical protein
MNIPKITRKLKEQIHIFSGKLSVRLPRVVGRFTEEMIYGIQSRGTVKLSEIARSLDEQIQLKKVIDRLSNNLGRERLGEAIMKELLKEGSKKIQEQTLLVLDITDITKPYAEKMENLARVRDGSCGELTNGYWLCEVVGVEKGSSKIIPLYKELYSQEASDFVSENHEIEKALQKVSRATSNRGVWVMDRGGDREVLYKFMLNHKQKFLVRLVGRRNLIYRGRVFLARQLAEKCPLPYADTLIKERQGKEKVYFIEYGFRKVKLPGREEPLYLVVIKGFGEEPMMLLSNVEMRKNRSVLWWTVKAYITRWRIEETLRFIKQSYQLEDIRVLTYRRLRNMMSLVLAASYFASVYLAEGVKLRILAKYILHAAKRIFGIPDFRYYAVADGIKELLFGSKQGTIRKIRPPNENLQLCLFNP